MNIPPPSRLIAWGERLAVICLCALAVAPLYPRLTAVINISAALALIVLAAQEGIRLWPMALPASALRLALVVFLFSGIASAIIPHVGKEKASFHMAASLHAFWNTLCAFALAWLAQHLLRDPAHRRLFFLVFALAAAMVATTVLLHKAICGDLAWRITGTKGGSNRWAILVLFASFPLWMALADRQTMLGRLPRWFMLASIGLAVLTPFLVHRQTAFGLLFDANGTARSTATSHLIWLGSFGATISAGLVYALLCRAAGIWRCLGIGAALAVLVIMLIVVMSRTALAAFFLTCPALWLWYRSRARRLILLLACLAALSGVAAVYLGWDYLFLRYSPQTLRCDLGVRSLIWRGAIEIFSEHLVWGCGYGQESFRDHWPFPPPFPAELLIPPEIKNFAHAHNLWLHLLATRGMAGWAAFMFLWATLFCTIAQRGRSMACRQRETLPGNDDSPLIFGMPWPPFIALLALAAVQIVGILELPLQEYNEILAALPVGIGLAYVYSDESPFAVDAVPESDRADDHLARRSPRQSTAGLQSS